MKNYFLLLLMISLVFPAYAQIVVDETDMPEEGDTLRVSLTTNIPDNYSQTGFNMTWDFSGLNKSGQQINSFVNIMSTPLIYRFTFIPGIISNLASPGNDLPAFPGIPFSDYFTFFNKSASHFSDVGYAFQLSVIPIMLKYDSPDIYYTLPCTIGNIWASQSFASVSLPALAYFSSSINRTSQVDGWGSLTTPFGTFQTIRIKSEVIEHDSVFLDTTGVGFPYTRNITEYKWLGKGQGIPLLQINEEGLIKTAIYRDVVNHTGLNELRKETFQVFPNPTDGLFEFKKGEMHFPAHMQILNNQGCIVMEEDLPILPGNTVSLNLSGLMPGLYMIRLIDEHVIYNGKVLIITR